MNCLKINNKKTSKLIYDSLGSFFIKPEINKFAIINQKQLRSS